MNTQKKIQWLSYGLALAFLIIFVQAVILYQSTTARPNNMPQVPTASANNVLVTPFGNIGSLDIHRQIEQMIIEYSKR